MLNIVLPSKSALIQWIAEQSKVQHQNNEKWWYDLNTGERLDRNKGELFALIHSEVSEAFEGLFHSDDKLPQYNGAQVELIDALIRILDFLGGFDIKITEDHVEDYKDIIDLPELDDESKSDIAVSFNTIHASISSLLEAYRKDKLETVEDMWVDLILVIIFLFKYLNHFIRAKMLVCITNGEAFKTANFKDVLEAKSEFNRNRADHKIENRKAEGGKKF